MLNLLPFILTSLGSSPAGPGNFLFRLLDVDRLERLELAGVSTEGVLAGAVPEGVLFGVSMQGVLTELAGALTGQFRAGESMEGVLMYGGCLLEPEAGVLAEPQEGGVSPLIEGVATLRLGLRKTGVFTAEVEVCVTGVDVAALERVPMDGVSPPGAGVRITGVGIGVCSDRLEVCGTGESAGAVDLVTDGRPIV